MKTIKTVGALLLALYLILVGVIGFGWVSPLALLLSHVTALGAGILIIVALVHCWHHGDCGCGCSCDKK